MHGRVLSKISDISMVLDTASIYVYGAGTVGELFASYVRYYHGIEVVAFVQTKCEIGKQINSIPVICIDNLIDMNARIVVAVLRNNRGAIIEELEKRNRPYFYLDEACINSIRMKYVNPLYIRSTDKLRLSEMTKFAVGFGEHPLVITDYSVDINIPYVKEFQCIQSKELFEYDCFDQIDSIICYNVNWDFDIISFYRRLLASNKRIFIAFKSSYINMGTTNLIDEIKIHGYQISEWHLFVRPRRFYDTDDIIALLEKRCLDSIQRNLLCNGCGKCIRECPTHALKLIPNKEYNYTPHIDEEKCVRCGKCLERCPAFSIDNNMECIDKENKYEKSKCYAVMASNEIRYRSTSGGAFELLARSVLSEGGYVIGACWTKEFAVKHIVINNIDDLCLLQKSKYMRSDIVPVMETIAKLPSNKTILFSGLPCQVAAVRSFFAKDTNKKIIYVDLICGQAPSDIVFRTYLSENFEVSNIEKVEFRSKEEGWKGNVFNVTLNKNGLRETIKVGYEDPYQMAYHTRLMMPFHCENCCYSGLDRVGDITIGDFWGIGDRDLELDDYKGTSAVIISSNEGEELFNKAVEQGEISKIKKVSARWLLPYNRVGNSKKSNPGRERFILEMNRTGFNSAVNDAVHWRFDIGLVGCWSHNNYGAQLTYFALASYLKYIGKSVLLIEWPEDSEIKPNGNFSLFECDPFRAYEIASPSRNLKEMAEYNYLCRMFIQGSDQLMNPLLYDMFQGNVLLPWVEEDKKKVAYALSFGNDRPFYREYTKEEINKRLKRFNGISVREKSGSDIMMNWFGQETEWVVDPVFLCPKERYVQMASHDKNDDNLNEKYIFSYMLDITTDKIYFLRRISKLLGYGLVVVPDALVERSSDYYSKYPEVIRGVSVERWLKLISGASFVVTDSFHGTCFAIIFEKQFISFANIGRGRTRFVSLLEMLKIEDRMLEEPCESGFEILDKKINYNEVNNILTVCMEKSKKWLDAHIN